MSFQEWTQQMRDMLDARKRGDSAFRDKDFKTAIECYSQVYLFYEKYIDGPFVSSSYVIFLFE